MFTVSWILIYQYRSFIALERARTPVCLCPPTTPTPWSSVAVYLYYYRSVIALERARTPVCLCPPTTPTPWRSHAAVHEARSRMNTIQGEGVENRYIYSIEPFVKWIVIKSTTPSSIQKEFYAPYMATNLNPWIVHYCTLYNVHTHRMQQHCNRHQSRYFSCLFKCFSSPNFIIVKAFFYEDCLTGLSARYQRMEPRPEVYVAFSNGKRYFLKTSVNMKWRFLYLSFYLWCNRKPDT